MNSFILKINNEIYTCYNEIGNEFYKNDEMNNYLQICNDFIKDVRIHNINNNNTILPECKIVYYDSELIDAFATKSSDIYYIGISIASVTKLLNIFSAIFENNKIYEKSFFVKDRRLIYKEKAMHMALSYLTAHEFSHITNGHCDIPENEGKMLFEQNRLFYKEEKSNLFSQTLEYDADCIAIATVVNNVLRNGKCNGELIEDIKEKFQLLAFSTYMIMNIFNENCRFEDFMKSDLLNTTHPYPNLRWCYMMANYYTVISLIGRHELVSYFSDDIIESVIHIANLIDKRDTNGFVMSPLTKRGSEHLILLNDNWKSVRECLLPYSYVKLAECNESKPFASVSDDGEWMTWVREKREKGFV